MRVRAILIINISGILSAYGMALADVVQECQEPSAYNYEAGSFGDIAARFKHLSDVCIGKLIKDGFKRDQIQLECYLHLR